MVTCREKSLDAAVETGAEAACSGYYAVWFSSTQGCGIHSTVLRGSCLVSRDGIETLCAVTELDSTNTCPGPAVFFWQINRALQGCAFSSQGESTWPPALWVSRLSRLSNTKLNKLHEKRWRTDLLPFPALTSESLTGWPNNMTLEMHWEIQKTIICLLQLAQQPIRTPENLWDGHPNEKIEVWHNSLQFWRR